MNAVLNDHSLNNSRKKKNNMCGIERKVITNVNIGLEYIQWLYKNSGAGVT